MADRPPRKRAPRKPPAPPEPPDCTCGGKIPAGRRDGFCSSWCAGRDAQGLEPQAPPPLALPPRPRVSASPTPPPVAAQTLPDPPAGDGEAGGRVDERPPYRQRRRLIADEYESRLRDAGMLEHWQAASILDLADALDWSRGSLSSRATAHRELERQMTALLRGVSEPGSKVGDMRDEVAARRARRQAAAGGAG